MMPGWEKKYGKLDHELDCYLEHSKKSDEDFYTEILKRIIVVDYEGNMIPDHLVKFPVGKLVTIEGSTFKIVYSNKECMTLEPVNVLSIGEEDA